MNLIKSDIDKYDYMFVYDTVKLYVDTKVVNGSIKVYHDSSRNKYTYGLNEMLTITPGITRENLEILLRGICLGILKVGCDIKNSYDEKKNGAITKSDYKYVLNQMMYVDDQWMFERDGEGLELDKLGRPVKNDN